MFRSTRTIVLAGATVLALATAGTVSWNGLASAAPAAPDPAAAPGQPTAFAGVLTMTGLPEPVQVLAYSWGVTNSGSTQVGGGAGAGRATVQDLHFTKQVDGSSVALIRAVVLGTHAQTATLALCDPKDCANTTTMTYRLEDLLVSSVSPSGAGAAPQTESVALNFGAFTITRGANSFSFNIAENSQS